MDQQPVSASGKPGPSAPQPAALRQTLACDANPQFLSSDEAPALLPHTPRLCSLTERVL